MVDKALECSIDPSLECGRCFTNISKKNTLRPGSSCTPSPPDGLGAYNVNSSSGCICPGTSPQGATMLHREATGAFRCTNPSNRTPREILFLLTAPNAPGRITTFFQCRKTRNPLLPVTPGSFPWHPIVSETSTEPSRTLPTSLSFTYAGYLHPGYNFYWSLYSARAIWLFYCFTKRIFVRSMSMVNLLKLYKCMNHY